MTYVKGLSQLYISSSATAVPSGDADRGQMINDSERAQILAALKDFSSIAKIGTLNNMFLMTFAELVEKKKNKTVSM